MGLKLEEESITLLYVVKGAPMTSGLTLQQFLNMTAVMKISRAFLMSQDGSEGVSWPNIEAHRSSVHPDDMAFQSRSGTSFDKRSLSSSPSSTRKKAAHNPSFKRKNGHPSSTQGSNKVKEKVKTKAMKPADEEAQSNPSCEDVVVEENKRIWMLLQWMINCLCVALIGIGDGDGIEVPAPFPCLLWYIEHIYFVTLVGRLEIFWRPKIMIFGLTLLWMFIWLWNMRGMQYMSYKGIYKLQVFFRFQ